MTRLILLALVAACGTDPVQIAGTYTVELTNGADGCAYGSTPGQQFSGVPVVFTQSGANLSATVNGLPGGALSIALGSNVFTGAIDGDALRNAEIVGAYANNSISGVVNYTNADNHNSDCIVGCVSVQNFAGSRPPP